MTKTDRTDEALRLFEALDGLDDGFIEEGMLPDEAEPKKRSRMLRALQSRGWVAAVVCAVAVLGVLVGTSQGRGLMNGLMDGKAEAEDALPGSPPTYETPNEAPVKDKTDGDVNFNYNEEAQEPAPPPAETDAPETEE